MSAEEAAIAALLGMTTPLSSSSCTSNDDVKGNYLKRKLDESAAVATAAAAFVLTPQATSASSTNRTDAATSDVPSSAKSRKKKSKIHFIEPSFPSAPRIVQVCKMPKTYVDHSYRDFSSVPPEPDYKLPSDLEDMTFAQKLHRILSSDEYAEVIDWCPHGRAFRILSPKRLEHQKILLTFFGHNRYSTFLSQIKNYGLKNLTKGKDAGAYYHEFLLRGLPHLCKYMPEFKEGRKLLADPANEPDFYTISALWPLPPKLPKPALTSGGGRMNPTDLAVMAGLFPPMTLGSASLFDTMERQRPTSVLAAMMGGASTERTRSFAMPRESDVASLIQARLGVQSPAATTSVDCELAALLRGRQSLPSNLSQRSPVAFSSLSAGQDRVAAAALVQAHMAKSASLVSESATVGAPVLASAHRTTSRASSAPDSLPAFGTEQDMMALIKAHLERRSTTRAEPTPASWPSSTQSDSTLGNGAIAAFLQKRNFL